MADRKTRSVACTSSAFVSSTNNIALPGRDHAERLERDVEHERPARPRRPVGPRLHQPEGYPELQAQRLSASAPPARFPAPLEIRGHVAGSRHSPAVPSVCGHHPHLPQDVTRNGEWRPLSPPPGPRHAQALRERCSQRFGLTGDPERPRSIPALLRARSSDSRSSALGLWGSIPPVPGLCIPDSASRTLHPRPPPTRNPTPTIRRSSARHATRPRPDQWPSRAETRRFDPAPAAKTSPRPGGQLRSMRRQRKAYRTLAPPTRQPR